MAQAVADETFHPFVLKGINNNAPDKKHMKINRKASVTKATSMNENNKNVKNEQTTYAVTAMLTRHPNFVLRDKKIVNGIRHIIILMSFIKHNITQLSKTFIIFIITSPLYHRLPNSKNIYRLLFVICIPPHA